MDAFTDIHYNWGNFWFTAIILVVLYALLRFIHRIIRNIKLPQRINAFAQRVSSTLILIFEPLCLLLLFGIFLLINPVFHGTLALVFLIFCYDHIRNYISGFFIRADKNIVPGHQINSDNIRGTISEVRRRFLKLKSKDGLHVLPYSLLLSKGYTLTSTNRMGGFHQLVVQKSGETGKHGIEQKALMDLLVMTPYIDWNYDVEISPMEDKEQLNFKVNIPVKNKSHLYDLIDLINESGYACQLIR